MMGEQDVRWDREGSKNIVVTVITEPDPTQDPGVDQLTQRVDQEVSENPSSGAIGVDCKHCTLLSSIHATNTFHLRHSFACCFKALLNALLGKNHLIVSILPIIYLRVTVCFL